MLKNLKVDIIYYQTASDFEMEFNMCGCCRMRLLTDKTADKKSFVGMLARAVSRSRIILSCGPLFGENGTISTVAAAIGKELCAADNAAYSIKSNERIDIISGSTPLVTPDGIFAGCIIESGPQTIVLLSESKAIRKTVMKNLIHPYIEQISTLSDEDGFFSSAPVAPEAPAEENKASAEQPAAIDNEESVEQVSEETDTAEQETEAAAEEQPEETTEESEIKEEAPAGEAEGAQEKPAEEKEAGEEEEKEENVAADAEEETTPKVNELPPILAPEAPDMFIEPERVKFSEKSSYALNYIPSDSDKMFLSDSDEEYHRHNPINISIIIIAAVLLVCLIAVAYLLVIVPLTKGVPMGEYLNGLFDVASSSPSSLNIL